MIRISHGRTLESGWQLVSAPLPSHLAPFVRSWSGYEERAPSVVKRLEMPSTLVTLILEFEPAICVRSPSGETRTEGSFVAGISSQATPTEHAGKQIGMQIDLTPLGARALLGADAPLLAERAVALGSLSRTLASLPQDLASMRSWEERFACLHALLLSRAADVAERPLIEEAQRRIVRSKGLASIAGIARALGCSREHLSRSFLEQVGLSPKAYAGVVRFERLVAALRSSRAPLSEIALAAGFSDQAQMAREVRRRASLTPTELRALLARSSWVTNVQDAPEVRP